MKRSRPAFLVVVHSIWVTIAAALLLASCTVVSTPSGYSYQPVPCPPNVTTQPPQAQQPQAQPPIPVPDGQAQTTEPQAPPPPPPAAQQAAPQCYAAVPNSYSYDYYPGVYAYPYGNPYYGYPYYAAPYYGYWYGGVWYHGHGHWH
jgi:hypothetical protein